MDTDKRFLLCDRPNNTHCVIDLFKVTRATITRSSYLRAVDEAVTTVWFDNGQSEDVRMCLSDFRDRLRRASDGNERAYVGR